MNIVVALFRSTIRNLQSNYAPGQLELFKSFFFFSFFVQRVVIYRFGSFNYRGSLKMSEIERRGDLKNQCSSSVVSAELCFQSRKCNWQKKNLKYCHICWNLFRSIASMSR